MGAIMSKFCPGSGPESTESMVEVDESGTTGDVFEDVLCNNRMTNTERKTMLKMLKKQMPESYFKRFGEATVEEVIQMNDMKDDAAAPAPPPTTFACHRGSGDADDELIKLWNEIGKSSAFSPEQKWEMKLKFKHYHPNVYYRQCAQHMMGKKMEEEGDREEKTTGESPGSFDVTFPD